MLKRLTTAAVGVVGLVVIGLGIASATVWRADDVLVATTSGGAHTLVTDPGVLELGGDPVTVKVSVPDGGTVVLAVGRDTDVAGWVGTDAHGQVTGLTAWHTLAVDDVAAPDAHRGADGRRRDGCRAGGARAGDRDPTPTEGADRRTADRRRPRPGRTCGSRRRPGTGLGRAGLARAGGPLEPARRQHRGVRAHPGARVAARRHDALAVAVRRRRHAARAPRRLAPAARRPSSARRARRAAVAPGDAPARPPRWSSATTSTRSPCSRDVRCARPRRRTRRGRRSGPVPQVPAPATAHSAPRRRAEPSRAPVPDRRVRDRSRPARGDQPPGAAPAHGGDPGDVREPGTRAARTPRAPGRRRRPSASRPPGPGTPPPAPGRPAGVQAGPSGAPGRPTGRGRPGRPTGAPAGSSAPAAPAACPPVRAVHPAGRVARPPDRGAPGPSGGAAGRAAPPPAPAAPHGRPSWVRGDGGDRADRRDRRPSRDRSAADPPAGRRSRRRPAPGCVPAHPPDPTRRCTPAGPPGCGPPPASARDGRPGDRRLPGRRLAPRVGAATDRGRPPDGTQNDTDTRGGAAMTRHATVPPAARRPPAARSCSGSPPAPRRSRRPSRSRSRPSHPAATTVVQSQDVLTDVGAVLAAADAALDPAQLPPRVEGPALAVRTAEYARATATAGAKPPTALPTDEQALIVPQTDVWPRTQLVVTKQPDDLQAPRILVMQQTAPREPYRLWGWGRMGAGVQMPATAAPGDRQPRAGAGRDRPPGDPDRGAPAVRGRPGERRRLSVRGDVPAGHVPHEHRGRAGGDGGGRPGGRVGDGDLHARGRAGGHAPDGRRRRDRRRPAHHRVHGDPDGGGWHDPDLRPVLRCAHGQARAPAATSSARSPTCSSCTCPPPAALLSCSCSPRSTPSPRRPPSDRSDSLQTRRP